MSLFLFFHLLSIPPLSCFSPPVISTPLPFFSICYTLMDLVSAMDVIAPITFPLLLIFLLFSACLSVFVTAHCHSITRTPIIPPSLPSFRRNKTSFCPISSIPKCQQETPVLKRNRAPTHNIQSAVNINLQSRVSA